MKDASVVKEKLSVDFVGEQVPDSVKNFMPDVYKDGDRYVCVLGSEPNSVTGEGATVEEAMNSWDKAYREKKK
jgi:hypothetical protein